MESAPIIRRELWMALRQKGLRSSRMIYASLSVALAILCLIIGNSSFSSFIHVGIFYLGLFAALSGPLATAIRLLVQDRQSQAFGFLFLAGVTPREHFWSKVASTFLITFPNLLALAPALAVTFLSGSISLSLFLSTMACLPIILLFLIALGCFTASLWREESTASVAAYMIGAILCGLPIGAYEATRWTSHSISELWQLLSPAWGPWMVLAHFTKGSQPDFWMNSAVTLGWIALFIWLAGLNMRREWDREISGYKTPTFKDRLHEWTRGNKAWRLKQKKWLDINPYAWIEMTNRQPVMLGWFCMGAVLAITLLAAIILRPEWSGTWILLAGSLILIVSIEWIMAYSSANRMAQDRRNQAFELLLTTPLEVHQIVQGEMLALYHLFRHLFIGAIAVCVSLMVWGFFWRQWTPWALVNYLLAWSVILGCLVRRVWPKNYKNSVRTIWAGLNTAEPALSVAKGWNWNAYLLWMIFVLSGSFRHVQPFPTGHPMESVIVALVAMFYFGITYFSHHLSGEVWSDQVEKLLLEDFRLIVVEPIPDPKDPRLKNWQVTRRLYYPRPTLLSPIPRARLPKDAGSAS